MSLTASLIIRTYNEQRYLEKLLKEIQNQVVDDLVYEVIIVDSGSTDKTLEIANKFNSKILNIKKSEFSFGRSLNIGCAAATGDYLIFISGHCVPVNEYWLMSLINPLIVKNIDITYGRQLGGETTKFSENQLFDKFFPKDSQIPQKSFFCNNANSAILKSVWKKYKFDESLTGLEDMYLGKQVVAAGGLIGYVAEAPVYHYHDESWSVVKRRYEREAIALQEIMPEVHINFGDFLRYFISAVLLDAGSALQQKNLSSKLGQIFMFRLMQFWGSYRGNHEHRKISAQMKEIYFYPRNISKENYS
jgi:glycosyltransferase involved in cell wall biosynthesis